MRLPFRFLFSALTILAIAAGSRAGPDVVVSGVGDSINKYGTNLVGGVPVTGYAIGSTACNIGDGVAAWFQSTDQHPVIGQQAYRLHAGRMEQIGLSWVKHTFCASDTPSCLQLGPPGAVYVPEHTCDYLGLFANDTYTATLNGFQNYLGPRSEVNASNGSFAYPYTLNWNTPGNCAYKRLQIANTDLDPAAHPGARYFFEVHYVTTDEVGASRVNNASYREFAVGALTSTTFPCTAEPGLQGYALSFLGGTQVFKPALQAWQDVDPTVAVAATDVPDDGRIIVAAKATDLGGGLWQYEYAVYNHNSDRCIGSFSVGKSDNAGVTISAIGFHDAAYHSGEPYDGADWPGVASATSIDWVTTPFAVDPNANAIRWATTYNFRFQANRAPTTGGVILGLFKPGTPMSIVVGGLPVPSMPALCPGDFNDSGVVSVQDIFDFLAAYFAGDSAADFNHSSAISVQDIFDFLAAYFTPCG